MKFEIDINDFWIEDEDLEVALKSHIQTQVVYQITKSIQEKIDAQITKEVISVINKSIEPIIKAKLDEFVKSGLILVSGKEISVEEQLKSVFQNSTGWSNPRTQIAELAAKFGNELKKTYDAVFANRIVVKLNEQGMLKDEVVKLLIN